MALFPFMPRLYDLHRYPAIFGDMLMKAALSPSPLIIPNAGPKEAKALRTKVYTFRRACEKHKEDAKARGLDIETMGLVQITVEGSNLILANRNLSPEAQRLQALVDALPSPPETTTPSSEPVPNPAEFLQRVNEGKDYLGEG